MNLFFTKKFRQNFAELASMTNSNAFEDSKKLIRFFGEIGIENQTRTFFVFDHILM